MWSQDPSSTTISRLGLMPRCLMSRWSRLCVSSSSCGVPCSPCGGVPGVQRLSSSSASSTSSPRPLRARLGLLPRLHPPSCTRSPSSSRWHSSCRLSACGCLLRTSAWWMRRMRCCHLSRTMVRRGSLRTTRTKTPATGGSRWLASAPSKLPMRTSLRSPVAWASGPCWCWCTATAVATGCGCSTWTSCPSTSGCTQWTGWAVAPPIVLLSQLEATMMRCPSSSTDLRLGAKRWGLSAWCWQATPWVPSSAPSTSCALRSTRSVCSTWS
mmetsp:Transcript_25745/g.82870  ORF Transcript_25745/g.82870 Transcript_25745/m.82870 type:complete len:269 (+) Transcript_25745:270-1076(+)